MNLDGAKPTAVRMEILAEAIPDPAAPEGVRKVDAGILFDPVPTTMTLSVRWVRKHLGRPKVFTVKGLRQVTRPSRPEPELDENGSAAVAAHHYAHDDDNPLGMAPPHEFLHADEFVFHTPAGDLVYEVTRQPDKYVVGDETGRKKVTAERYAAGETEVDNHFTLRLKTEKKG